MPPRGVAGINRNARPESPGISGRNASEYTANPQREIICSLEASLDHLWATLFHHLLPMGKGWLFGKLSRGGEQQLRNTLITIGSQGKIGENSMISR